MKKKKATKKYEIDKFSPKQIATIMDFINNYVIKYYIKEIDDKPDPHHIQGLLYKKDKRYDSVRFELAMNLMESEGYIRCLTEEGDTAVKSITHTEKGLEIFFKGGFRKDFAKKRREKRLVITGQISIILAGLYYLLEILKEIFV